MQHFTEVQFQDHLATLSRSKKEALYADAKKAYYCSDTPVLSDDNFDILEEHLGIDPGLYVGSSVSRDNNNNNDPSAAVPLAFWMGSLDKIKDKTEAVCIQKYQKWISTVSLKSGGFLSSNTSSSGSDHIFISDKLDGISCLWTPPPPPPHLGHNQNNSGIITTRGTGSHGSDITHHLSTIQGIPRKWYGDRFPEIVGVRGELVLSKRDFSKISKHIEEQEDPSKSCPVNARNTVCGLVKAKTSRYGLPLVTFVAYECIYSDLCVRPLGVQLESLGLAGFVTVWTTKIPCSTSPQTVIRELDTLLARRHEASPYQVDGLVLSFITAENNNNNHILFPPRATARNPPYAIAYKKDFNTDAVVSSVEWRLTKGRMLKPRVHLEHAVDIGGSQIRCVTGHNASFVVSNGIGPNAKILLTRAGDVIPHIVEVITPSTISALTSCNFPFRWGETKVDIYIGGSDESILSNPDYHQRKLEHLVKTLDIKYISTATIQKLVSQKADVWEFPTADFLNLTKEDFLLLPGFGDSSASRAFDSLSQALARLRDPSVPFAIRGAKCMTASGCFPDGIGVRRVASLLQEFPGSTSLQQQQQGSDDYIITKDMIRCKVHGISGKIAGDFVMGRVVFSRWIARVHMEDIFFSPPPQQPLSQQQTEQTEQTEQVRVCFTGARDRELEERIQKKYNGLIENNVTANTTHLIVKDVDTGLETAKAKKAIALGVKNIWSLEDADDFWT